MSASTSFKPSIRDAGELTDHKLYGSFRSLNRYEAPILKSKHEDIFKNKEFESAQVPLPPKPASGNNKKSDDKQHNKKSSSRSKRSETNNNNSDEKKSKSKVKHKSLEQEKKDDEFIKYLGERHERRRKNKYSNDETNNNQDNFENSSMRKMNSSKERLHKPDKEEEETKQKIISKLNAFSANSKSDNESDSDNNNDNNNNNNTENEVEVDVQRLGSAKQNESLIKANQNSEFVKLILNFNTAEFVLTPAPQGQTVNCKILCRRGLINEYHFFLEQSDTANILLLKTHKRMASAKASHFIDVINYNEFGQRSSNEISCAKCSSNMARKKFKLNIDTNNFPLVETNTILNVLFRSNSGEPRKVISTALLCNGTQSSREKITYVLKNRPPHYDINMRKFVLNYNGRAKQSSKNNFQIYDESVPDEILMQLGKVETGEYNCDYTWPLCAMQAFGLALASLSR